MATTEMFTKGEAVAFLQDTLGIKDVEGRFSTDRKALLQEIVTAVQARVPFQSITLMATPPSERRRPSVADIKLECTTGVGGLCYNLNVFAWGLLRGAGFNARLCPATCFSTVTSPDNHVIVLVTGVEAQADLHLVECGFGFPTFRSVCLDFEDKSSVFVDSFLEYQYVRDGDVIHRMHGDGDLIRRNDPIVEGLDLIVGKWRRFYTFKVAPTDSLSDFDPVFNRVFTVPKATPFDQSPRCLHFPNGRAVVVVNNKLMLENDTGKLETTVLENDEQIVKSYQRYFPQAFSEDTVRKALREWHRVQQQ